jgi:hypothetical protein
MGPTSAWLGTAEAINDPKFHADDQVVLIEASDEYERGTFVRLKDDVKWAAIEETSAEISSHPVTCMLANRKLLSYTSLTGREKG